MIYILARCEKCRFTVIGSGKTAREARADVRRRHGWLFLTSMETGEQGTCPEPEFTYRLNPPVF